MKKIKVKVVRECEYEIEIDETVWNEENIEEFSKCLYPADNIDDIAEYVARAYFHQGEGAFLEGFGIPMVDGRNPYFVFGDQVKHINKDIIVHEISEDVYVEDCY